MRADSLRLMAYFICILLIGDIRNVAAQSEPINCEALKTSLVPYELRERSDDDSDRFVRYQIFRDNSGENVIWTQSVRPKPGQGRLLEPSHWTKSIGYSLLYRTTTSGSYIDTESDLNNVTKREFQGIDPSKQFNPETKSLAYKVISTTEYKNGKPKRTFENTITYSFERMDKVNIGSCLFTAFVGKLEDNFGERTRWILPELRFAFDRFAPPFERVTIHTSFSPIAP